MASPSPVQGDQQDLPAPWIRQYDANYQTFFYVDPTTNPPTTSWTHPGLQEGQVHPEQVQAIHEGQQTGGQGEAAQFLNSASVAAPVPGDYQGNQQSIQGADGQTPQAGDRGLGSMVNSLMGKQGYNNQGYGYNNNQGYNQGYNQQGYQQQGYQQQSSGGNKMGFGTGIAAGGAALLAGKMLSNVIGGHHHGGGMLGGGGHFGHNMGAPPFMGGGGMGGMGGFGGGHHGGGGMFGGGGHHGGGGFGGGGFGGGGGGPGGGGGGGW